jgi:AraC-like DNA-binding protein
LDHRSQLVRIAGLVLSIELRSLQATRLRPAHEDEALLSGLSKLSVNEIMDSQVGDLAQRFNFSQRHLNRLFHQHFGLSFAALRMEIRLLKAACLLRDPAAKVLNVAGDCGFNHLSLFNSCFKARFGTSPGQWRKDGAGKPRTPDRDKLNGYPGCSLFVNGLCPWSGKTAPQLPGRLGARPLRREAAVRLATAVGGARTLAGNRQRRATVTAGVASGARVAALIGEERPLQAARPAGGDGESFAALIAKRIEAAARTELGSASPPKQTKGNGR